MRRFCMKFQRVVGSPPAWPGDGTEDDDGARESAKFAKNPFSRFSHARPAGPGYVTNRVAVHVVETI